MNDLAVLYSRERERMCCEKSHPCGKRCYSVGRLAGELSGCTAEQVVTGVYRCDLCKVIVCEPRNTLENYLAEITTWYSAFCESNRDYLWQLKQSVLLDKALSEDENALYKAAQEFVDANGVISNITKSESLQMRQSVYALVCAYEKLKSILE